MTKKKVMNPKHHPDQIEKSDVKKGTLIDYLKTMEGKEFVITFDFGQEAGHGKKRE